MKNEDILNVIHTLYNNLSGANRRNLRLLYSKAVAELERRSGPRYLLGDIVREMCAMHDRFKPGDIGNWTTSQFITYSARWSSGSFVIEVEVIVDEDSSQPYFLDRYFIRPNNPDPHGSIRGMVESFAQRAGEAFDEWIMQSQGE